MIKVVMFLLGLVACASAFELSLKDRIAESLNAFSGLDTEAELEGVQNCPNKCDKVFNRMAYQISVNGNNTFEYTSCLIGCNKCQAYLNQKPRPTPKTCFEHCKNYDWKGNGILKGVIEPDKACMAGCIINNCQVICSDGSEQPYNSKTKKLYWPNGGCTIKTESYSQSSEYVPWNSPNTGQGGNTDVAKCCGNALSFCDYKGPQDTDNYRILYQVTGSMCATWVPSRGKAEICAFFNNPVNCGKL